MAPRDGQVKLSYEALVSRCQEQEVLIHTLHDQIRPLELERDQAAQGVQLLTEALRRRGCCDGDQNNGAQ